MTKDKKHHGYWQAQGFAEKRLSQYQHAIDTDNTKAQRRLFYRVADYYGRTLHILNTAFKERNEELAQAVLHNLLVLHRTLLHMHRDAPEVVPLPEPFSHHDREVFVRDLVMRVLDESPEGLDSKAIAERVNHLDMLGKITPQHVKQKLHELESMGNIALSNGIYKREPIPYTELELDRSSLKAMVGPELYNKFAETGFPGIRDVHDQPEVFRSQFPILTGMRGEETSELFVQTANLFLEVVRMLLHSTIEEASAWNFFDLLHSPFPRPYQRAAFAAFSHNNYRSSLVDAPTGSGKTLVGMMCIQDWLNSLSPGHSILILVPTSNYQQQWVDELCYNPIGLQLPREVIFSGTPLRLENYVQETGSRPAILLMTYTGLAQLASFPEEPGFNPEPIEELIKEGGVQYVIMDEVHKVVENVHSVSHDIAGTMVAWQKAGKLRGLIGFSGTAKTQQARFEELGFELVYSVPIETLVAAGFVAPYAEFGVPFAYSARERTVRRLLDEYKSLMREYFVLLNPAQLRKWFGEIPMEERIETARALFNLGGGHKDWQAYLRKRFTAWENGKPDALALTETRMVILLQIINGWSDEELVSNAGAETADFTDIREKLDAIRTELLELVYQPKTIKRLKKEGFTTTLDSDALQKIPSEFRAAHDRIEATKDIIASTITGLYDGLGEWYRRVGEGRVETIKAIVEAGRAVRDISGIIVFDTGRHINWHEENPTPGYVGVGGLFSQMLGDDRFVVLAALSNEMYLTYSDKKPVTEDIASYIETHLMQGEVADSITNLVTQGLRLSKEVDQRFKELFNELLAAYMPRAKKSHAARPGDFHRRVISPLRKRAKKADMGIVSDRALSRMDRRNSNLAKLVRTFFDYALLARHFREAHVCELEQVSGAKEKFFVVTMPSGSRRKQMMYDLTSRVVDEESLPVNVVIVSNWARTGWNVVKPNKLIDATATRNVTAWQQLRGRSIRAWRTWNNDCYRLNTMLLGHHAIHETVGDESEEFAQDGEHLLDQNMRMLLGEIATPEQIEQIDGKGIDTLSEQERSDLALALMKKRNKVAHNFELIKAYGSTSQITYDRNQRVWHRKPSIAAKHFLEISVNPFTGEITRDDTHSPLLFSKDPRKDSPQELQDHLTKTIEGCDQIILNGWLAID